jgi:zinc transporter ZupT
MVIFSGLMEKIIDGIALGVVFNIDKGSAMSTFLAVWAHELPA